jgi:S1-C subfamily serine protease
MFRKTNFRKKIERGVEAALLFCFFSCSSAASREQRLVPLKPAGEFRLADIEEAAADNPVRAVHLIGMYRAHYQPAGESGKLDSYWKDALDALKTLLEKAVAEKRFDDAVSLARSLSNAGADGGGAALERELLLEDAKNLLEKGENLAAFIKAVQADTLETLSFADALLFLQKAAAAKQRGTAAFFLSIAEKAGKQETREKIPKDLREFAEGRDLPRDMIKGVATVLVDQGTHIEKGRAYPSMVLGSAFFVDASGLLITNHHVIESEVDPAYEGYSRMYIRMGDVTSPRIPAKVVGYDKAMDLALIKTSITPEYVFSIFSAGDWSVPQVGDPVIAIGSPVGLEKTVTQGIISAVGRRLLQIGDVIQIDAAVNHGNSGGPVLDKDGRLAGVVFAGADRYQGLNFAIPVQRLASALPALIKGKKAERPWLGLTLAETAEGAEIIYVAPNTPASDLAVKEGSVIASINGGKINAPQGCLIPALQDALFGAKPGELVSLETKDGASYIMASQIRPSLPLAEAVKLDSRERVTAPLFGFILAPSLSDSPSSAYLIKKVIRGSIADDAGFSKDDPVTIRSFRVIEKEGYAYIDISVKKRRMGYLETYMRLPATLDTPNTL